MPTNPRPLPIPPETVEQVPQFCRDLVRTLQSVLQDMPSITPTLNQATAYTATNVTEDRSFDANATTVNELADVVGTMLSDLRDRGILG